MAGKRVDTRAHEGPEENRAHQPQRNRKAKLRVREPDKDSEGLSAKDAARMKAWKNQ